MSEVTPIDELTSLPNHLFFNQMLNKALAHAKRHHKKLALLLIDIDNFMLINDNYGLELSNLALQEMARRLKSILRHEDSLARLANDEFAVLLTDLEHPKMLGPVVEKILNISKEPIEAGSQSIKLTLSIGIAIFPEDGLTLEGLQKNASLALSRAKQAGGNNYQFFVLETKLLVEDYVEIHNSLSQALAKKEFVLHYQPKLDLKKNKICGVEALIRWNHPQHGLLSPSRFIPIAEENNLILSLDEWVLREACHTNKEWQNQGYKPIIMSVNLSPQQFHHPHLPELIEKILQETQLDPRYLDLEITEMTVMDDTHRINEFLSRIKNKGISISIDDFGTGNTSLRYLKDFPINVLKIDRSFISPLPEDEGNARITCNMINLAHELGISVVAEGVENQEQLEFLTGQQCDLAQGYFISRPLPASQLVGLLEPV